MSNTSITIFIFNVVVLFVVNVFFIFAGIFLNSVVIMSLWNSQLRRKLCYFMIFILACFDLAVVVVFHLLIILQIISIWVSLDFNNFALKKPIILSALSAAAYLTMTLERYLALMYPFFHEKFVTKPKLMIAFMTFQLPFGILHMVELNGPNMAFLTYTALFAVVLLTTCILNFKLFYFAKTKLRQRGVETLRNLHGSTSEQRNVDTRKFKGTLASLRKISTCLLAVLCLLICHVPAIVDVGLQITKQKPREEYKFLMSVWADTILALNSSLNCLIFFYKNSVLRRHGQMFFKKYFLRKP